MKVIEIIQKGKPCDIEREMAIMLYCAFKMLADLPGEAAVQLINGVDMKDCVKLAHEALLVDRKAEE